MGFNLIKMFTPPKSKSPWEAMTSGSTGGWAKFASPTQGSGIGKFIGPALTAAAGIVSPWLSAGMGAAGMGGVGGFQGTDSGLGKGIMDTLGGAITGWGLGGVGSGIGQGVSSALGSGGSNMLGSFMSGFSKGAGNYLNTTLAPFGLANTSGAAAGMSSGYMPGMGISAANSAYAPTATGISGMVGGSAITSPYYAALGAAPATAMNPYMVGGGASMLSGLNTGAAVTGANNWMNNLSPQMLGGLGMLASSAIPQTPKYAGDPMIGELTSRLLGGKGISEVGALSRTKLMDMMNADPYTVPDEYYNAATRRIDDAYAQAERDMVSRYKHYGAEDSTDFNSQIKKLRQDQAREKAALGAELEYANYQNTMNRTYEAIKTGIGVDDSIMQELIGLTGISAQEAALKYGAEVADVESLRNMLGTGGGIMLQGAMNQQTNAAQLEAMKQMNKYQMDTYSRIYGNQMLGGV